MSAQKTTITVEDCLRGAFAALLKGDTATRDKLCAAAERAFNGRAEVPGDTPVYGGPTIDGECSDLPPVIHLTDQSH